MAKNGNIVKYRRPFTLNIGLIILLILFGYIVFSSYSYINKDKISFYEVTDGGMAKNTEHIGIAIRNELPQYSDSSGYLNPLVTSGKRISVGDEIFAVDKSGSLKSYLSSDSISQIQLNENDITNVKNKLSEFSQNYRDEEFADIYDVKAGINATLIDYVNAVSNQNFSENALGLDYRKFYSPATGVISFSIDGFENRVAESINIDDFNTKTSVLNVFRSGTHVENGDVVCKIVASENWDLIFQLSKEEEKVFSDINRILIKFKKMEFPLMYRSHR